MFQAKKKKKIDYAEMQTNTKKESLCNVIM